MAQVDFFLCKEEKMNFAELLFKFGFWMIPDLHYRDNSYITISTLKEYESYASNNFLLFIVHPETFLYDLEMNSFEKEGSLYYYIQQRHGGPTIDFYSPGAIEIRDQKIGPGFLGNYPFFYHNKEKVYLDQKSIDFFNMLSKFIKQHSNHVKLKKRGFWIGKKTIELCRTNDYSLVEINGSNLLNMVI